MTEGIESCAEPIGKPKFLLLHINGKVGVCKR